jgi:hypothetical protein
MYALRPKILSSLIGPAANALTKPDSQGKWSACANAKFVPRTVSTKVMLSSLNSNRVLLTNCRIRCSRTITHFIFVNVQTFYYPTLIYINVY